MKENYLNSDEFIKYKKNFLSFIDNLEQDLSEKWIIKIKNDIESIFSKVSEILDKKEFINISFDKMLTILNTLKFKEQFKTNYWFLKSLICEWGFSVNIDLWNYCNHSCTHCMISATQKEEQTNIWDFLKKMDYIPKKYFSKLIKEISFYNFWEFLDYKDFDKIFEYFLKRWVNNFIFTTRWPIKEDIRDVSKKIIKLKEVYKNFNLNLVLSFDDFLKISPEENLKNLIMLFFLNRDLFKNKKIEIKPTFNFNTYKEDYKNFLNKISVFLEILNINYRDENIFYNKNWVIKKIVLDSWFEISILINIIKPIWRWKKITKIKFDNSWLDFTNCSPVIKPFSFNLDSNWYLKTCLQKDIWASIKYSYSNIEDEDFMKKFIKIKRDFFENIEIKDLIWKGNKHFCMAVNLLQEKNN